MAYIKRPTGNYHLKLVQTVLGSVPKLVLISFNVSRPECAMSEVSQTIALRQVTS